jgi:hypothetical protein
MMALVGMVGRCLKRLGTSVLCEDISAGGSDDEMLTPEPCAPDMDI